jgi:pyruvate dehydrogenase (quinone)
VFGYPGDGINGVFGALNRADGKLEFIQARHEEMAAFMASAYAKFSGELGVCIATSGPGASHLTTGLYDALLDHQPVLAIVGQQSRNALGGQYQQELDLVSMLKDVASTYVVQASAPAQVRHLVDRAARIALSQRTDLRRAVAGPGPQRAMGMRRILVRLFLQIVGKDHPR